MRDFCSSNPTILTLGGQAKDTKNLSYDNHHQSTIQNFNIILALCLSSYHLINLFLLHLSFTLSLKVYTSKSGVHQKPFSLM